METIELMKMKCKSCGKITYREAEDGLVSTQCMFCYKQSYPTGDRNEIEFEEF